jgi:hypothetical protein
VTFRVWGVMLCAWREVVPRSVRNNSPIPYLAFKEAVV